MNIRPCCIVFPPHTRHAHPPTWHPSPQLPRRNYHHPPRFLIPAQLLFPTRRTDARYEVYLSESSVGFEFTVVPPGTKMKHPSQFEHFLPWHPQPNRTINITMHLIKFLVLNIAVAGVLGSPQLEQRDCNHDNCLVWYESHLAFPFSHTQREY